MKECPYCLEFKDIPLQKNALRVEMWTPELRCLLKPPEYWSDLVKSYSLNWILSGGSCLVFGYCTKCGKYT